MMKNWREIEGYLGNRLRVHHIGIIVRDMEKSIDIYKKLGYSCDGQMVIDVIQNNQIVFMESLDEIQKIELISPLDKKSSVYNFRDGYHHICYDVSRYPDFLERFKEMKIGKIFTAPMAAPAINGSKVVFALLYNKIFVEFIIRKAD